MKRGMKKLALIVLVAFFWASGVEAAGTATVSLNHLSQDGKALVIRVACIGDVATGSVPNTLISPTSLGTADYTKAGWFLYSVKVVTGVTKPDAADLAIVDASGATLFSQANVIPATGTSFGTMATYHAITSGVSVIVTNQATAGAAYYIDLTLAK